MKETTGDTFRDDVLPTNIFKECFFRILKQMWLFFFPVLSAICRLRYNFSLRRAEKNFKRVIKCPSNPEEFDQCAQFSKYPNPIIPNHEELEYFCGNYHDIQTILHLKSEKVVPFHSFMRCLENCMYPVGPIWDDVKKQEEEEKRDEETILWLRQHPEERISFTGKVYEHLMRNRYEDIAKEFRRFAMAYPNANLEEQYKELYIIAVCWFRKRYLGI